jgi:hypothetical protein
MSRKQKHRIATKPNPLYEKIADDINDKIPDEVLHSRINGGEHHQRKEELRIRTQAIAIGIPMDELMFSKFFENFIGLDLMPWDSTITTASTYLPDARNKIHNIFLKESEASHLLMLDSDVLPPPRLIEKLLLHDKDMVGGWYSKKEKFPVKGTDGKVQVIQRPVVYDFSEVRDGMPYYVNRVNVGKGLEKVDAAGAGLWLMSRKAAEALGENPYGDGVGEDLLMCYRLKQAGFELFIDWDIHAAHCGVFYV